MTFGKIKSILEHKLLESYKNQEEFKKNIVSFKKFVNENKNIARLFSLYDDLSKPQGLTEEDATLFLNEGLSLIEKFLSETKLPKIVSESKIENNYNHIDSLVYNNSESINLNERLKNKKQILNVLTQKKNTVSESIKIPVNTMVKVANKTIENYIQTLDENSKKEFLEIIREDKKVLKEKFSELKDVTEKKLKTLIENESDDSIKSKINETISKMKIEEFSEIGYLKLKELSNSI